MLYIIEYTNNERRRRNNKKTIFASIANGFCFLDFESSGDDVLFFSLLFERTLETVKLVEAKKKLRKFIHTDVRRAEET